MKRFGTLALALIFLTGAVVTTSFAQDAGSGSQDTAKKKKKKKKATNTSKPPAK
jgi:hypothetical protein